MHEHKMTRDNRQSYRTLEHPNKTKAMVFAMTKSSSKFAEFNSELVYKNTLKSCSQNKNLSPGVFFLADPV